VVKRLTHQIVDLAYVGSNPISRPIFKDNETNSYKNSFFSLNNV
jgi:hypothetical protein